jgi:hypothetical protein
MLLTTRTTARRRRLAMEWPRTATTFAFSATAQITTRIRMRAITPARVTIAIRPWIKAAFVMSPRPDNDSGDGCLVDSIGALSTSS